MDYTLNQLQIFLKVTETESITKAAEALFLTQPAVSIQLKNFQTQFEIPLTEVVGRKLYITDFGREIAVSVAEILNQVQEINYKTQAFKGQLAGRLKISIVSTGKYIMPFFITDFLRLHPGVELVMDVTNKSSVIESLEQNEVDFSLVSILPEGLNTERMDLMQNKLYLIGNAESEFTASIYQPKILEEIALIFRERGSGTRQTMEQFIQRNQIFVRKKMELTSNEAVKQAVLAGMGYSIMPLIGLKNELLNKNLQIIPVKGLPIQTTWSLIWMKGKKHSPVAAAYLKFLASEKESLIASNFKWYEQY